METGNRRLICHLSLVNCHWSLVIGHWSLVIGILYFVYSYEQQLNIRFSVTHTREK